LLQQVAAGNESAFRTLFYAWHQKLGSFVYNWTKSLPITEEIVQDVFLKIWMTRESLTTIERFDNYLYVLARNQAFNILKKASRERVKHNDWERSAENMAAYPDALPLEEYSPLISKAVAQLPDQQKKVYELKYGRGLKYEEIGLYLNISPETARKHMQLAIRFITAYLQTNTNILVFLLSANILGA
jgi:RNA polymerase sigma-70 factor (ECF subfamily)